MKQSLILSILLVSLTIGCATTKPLEVKGPYWPTLPDDPRIEFVKNITELKDIGYEKSIFKKIFELFFGKELSPKIIKPIGVLTVDGKLFVTDTDLQVVHVFDLKNSKYFQLFKNDIGRLVSPIGVAVGGNGNIFVTDSILNRIFIYDSKYKFVKSVGNDDYVRITGIAYSSVNNLFYVVDTGAHKLHVVSPDGEKVSTIGSRGSGNYGFNFPTHITIDKKGDIYITDSLNFRVLVFDKNGGFIKKVGQLGKTIGSFSKPKGVAVDASSNIYVVDGLYDLVQIFNADQQLLMSFGKSGSKRGELWLPAGISIDSNNLIYVADTYNHRVSVFRLIKDD